MTNKNAYRDNAYVSKCANPDFLKMLVKLAKQFDEDQESKSKGGDKEK